MGHRFAIYVRISKDPLAESSSPARQEKECRRYARERGLDVVEIFTDTDRSAYRQDVVRPGYEAMLEAMAAGTIDGVLVWKLDRLMRRITEFSRFWAVAEKHRVALVSKNDPVDTTTPLGLAIVYLIVALAEQESRNTSLRARARHLELAEHGELSGGGRRPFGYEKDRKTICEDEAAEIRDAAHRILAGESLRGIAHDWRARGVPTVTETASWNSTTIKRLLCSGRISGQREHQQPAEDGQKARKRIVGPAVWDPIITPDETARLRVALSGNGQTHGGARSYLLTGFVRCGHCGTAMSARAAIRKGHRYRRYHCAKDRGGCDKVGISAERLEEYVTEIVLSKLDGPALGRLTQLKGDQAQIEAMEQVRELEDRVDGLTRDHYIERVIGRSSYLTTHAELEARLADAREAAAVRRPADVLGGLEGGLRVAWPELTLARRRAVVGLALDSIEVGATTRANNRFDSGRVKPPHGNVVWRL